jgi:hypothetical protein
MPHDQSPPSSPASDFWGITAIFEPVPSPHTLRNLARFSAGVRRQGLPLAIVELAFGEAPFRVPESAGDRVLRLRGGALLWQKERLLNLLTAALPAACRYVAWLDADVLFENDHWVRETRARLDKAPVVQPFEDACWLGPGETTAPHVLPAGVGEGHAMRGMAATLSRADDRRRALVDYASHGHTGFAWAARRDLLARHGIYDRHILGLGDFITAHAFAGGIDFLRGRHLVSRDLGARERRAVEAWGLPVAEETGGRIDWTPGRVLHLHHGPIASRRYAERRRILKDADFDPASDIVADADGLWQWASDRPALHDTVAAFLTAAPASLSPV